MRATAHCLVILIGCGACTSYATITRTDGRRFDAKVVGSDAHYLYLDHEETGGGYIPRREVEAIDHPGNVAATLGTVTLGVGLALIVGGLAVTSSCGGDFCGFYHLFLTIPGGGVAALGLPPMIWGFVVWDRSVEASQGHGPPHAAQTEGLAAPPAPNLGFRF